LKKQKRSFFRQNFQHEQNWNFRKPERFQISEIFILQNFVHSVLKNESFARRLTRAPHGAKCSAE